VNEKEALNKYWIKEILEMNNENDLNTDVLVESDNKFIKFNFVEIFYYYMIFLLVLTCIGMNNKM